MSQNRPLVEVDGCVYDAELLSRAHGFEELDTVGREAFVNHIHIRGSDREREADDIIRAWCGHMASKWPHRVFRIYRHSQDEEIIVRFHMVRSGVTNWYEGAEGKLIVFGSKSGKIV